MKDVFYERVNLNVEFDAYLTGACIESIDADFDHEKTAALIAALKMLRSRKSFVKIWIFDAARQDLIEKTSKLATYLFGGKVELYVGDVAALVESGRNHEKGFFDIFIVVATDEVTRLSVLDCATNFLNDTCFLLFASFFDIDRYDSLFSRRSQLKIVEDRGFVIIESSYYCFAARGFNFNVKFRPRLDVDHEVQAHSLFVFGCQRSGTSLLFQILNTHRKVLISFEANAHILKNRSSFIDGFNRRSMQQSRQVSKGFYLPTLPDPDLSITELYRRFQRQYLFFGDKIAHGPRSASYEICSANKVFDHLIEEFPFAKIALSCRRPLTNIFASVRINGNVPLAFVVDNWVSGILKVIEILTLSETSVLCPAERILGRDVRPLAALTGLDFTECVDVVQLTGVTSAASDASAYFATTGKRFQWVIDGADALYERLVNCIDPVIGRPHSECARTELQTVHHEFKSLYLRFLESRPFEGGGPVDGSGA